ncbi:hypothetical protein PROFUN_11606 [Planoprotostelium fungivorum]|uniref:Uncharacterized protein n=1 Tax=Planoprotostelium fungivorum TaxID=1890364 RepID=A0A2P6N2A8_9EUKA|nr:hypothetical protein PROFUN_11606 [Planoprotostelium fungivorum]
MRATNTYLSIILLFSCILVPCLSKRGVGEPGTMGEPGTSGSTGEFSSGYGESGYGGSTGEFSSGGTGDIDGEGTSGGFSSTSGSSSSSGGYGSSSGYGSGGYSSSSSGYSGGGGSCGSSCSFIVIATVVVVVILSLVFCCLKAMSSSSDEEKKTLLPSSHRNQRSSLCRPDDGFFTPVYSAPSPAHFSHVMVYSTTLPNIRISQICDDKLLLDSFVVAICSSYQMVIHGSFSAGKPIPIPSWISRGVEEETVLRLSRADQKMAPLLQAKLIVCHGLMPIAQIRTQGKGNMIFGNQKLSTDLP